MGATATVLEPRTVVASRPARAPQAAASSTTLEALGLALASAGAGVVHLTAAPDHAEHLLVFLFFLGAGVFQILWACLVVAATPSRWAVRLGALANAAFIGAWLASRTAGISFVEGADHREPVGAKDVAAVVLELVVVVWAVLELRALRSGRARPRAPAGTTASLAVATIVLTVAGVLAPTHHHAGDHAHETAEHLAASAHGHAAADAAGDHGHASGLEHAAHDAGVAHAASHDTSGAHPAAHASHPTGTSHDHQTKLPVTPAKPAVPKVAYEGGITKRIRYGPIVMPPASLGGTSHHNKVLTAIEKPCSDCFLTGAVPDLVYEDGSPANFDTGPMLHHAVWTRSSIKDTTCGRDSGTGIVGERFFGAGNERTDMKMLKGFGYYVGNDPWNVIVEIMNHSETAKTVYVQVDWVYRPAESGLKKLTPVWLDVNNCVDSQYSVPAGPTDTLWTWTSTITGRVIGTGGHVHDGGVKTVLTNETTGEHMCTSVASYGKSPSYRGHIESMSTCQWDRLGTVRKGEQLGIRSFYDSDVPQNDVMGIMLAFVYQTTDLDGGTPAPKAAPPPDPDPPPVHDH